MPLDSLAVSAVNGVTASGMKIDKLLYVLPKTTYFSQGRRGRVTHALGLCSGLAANGVQVTVVSGPGLDTLERTLPPSIRYIEVPVPAGRRLRELRWSRTIRAAVGDELRRDPEIRCVLIRYSVSRARSFLPLLREFPQRLIGFEVNSLAYHQFTRLSPPLRRAMLRYECGILNRAKFLYVVSRKLGDDIRVVSDEASPPLIVMPNAGPEDLSGRVRDVGLESGGARPVKFTYLGVFQPYYDLLTVISAFRELRARHENAELHLYGDGPLLNSARQAADGAESIRFHGRYDLNDLLRCGALDTDTVLLLPYAAGGLAEIGSPTKLFEYMALGLPIISTPVGQISEILRDEETAVFYRPGDRASLAQKMEAMMESPEGRMRLTKNLKASYVNEHTWAQRTVALKSFLRSLL